MSHFVLDSSVTMAWCFEDEKTTYTESVLDAVAAGTAVVPTLWTYEVLNLLVMAQRRKRMTQAQAMTFWKGLQSFSIQVDDHSAHSGFLAVMSLAEQYQLTAYDAAYLELALRTGFALASLDGDLAKAAKASGVSIACASGQGPEPNHGELGAVLQDESD
jgi:predicted nucleic acid-binding protein